MDSNNYKKQLKKEKAELENLISEMKDNTLFGDTSRHTSERYSSGELSVMITIQEILVLKFI